MEMFRLICYVSQCVRAPHYDPAPGNNNNNNTSNSSMALVGERVCCIVMLVWLAQEAAASGWISLSETNIDLRPR